MAAVALYTITGCEDDSPDHPNAFFLPRLSEPVISLEELKDCFPLAGEFLFSYRATGREALWRTMTDDEDLAPLDEKKRLFLRVLPVRDLEMEAYENTAAEAEASPKAGGHSTEDLAADMAELHTPSAGAGDESPQPSGPASPSPTPSPKPAAAEENMTQEEKAAASIKDEGNKSFKSGQFPAAIASYSKALEIIVKLPVTKTQEKLYCDCLGNRAACRIQERDFEMAVEDCNFVLEKQPKNVKALVRRGTSFEHIEKHKKALADFEAALAIDVKNKSAQQSAVRLRKLIKTLYG